MLRNQDEDELREILSETYITTNYVDQEIEQFIQNPHEEVQVRNLESNQSHSSRRSSESSQYSFWRDDHSFESSQGRNSEGENRYSHEKVNEKGMPFQEQTLHIFDQFYKTINRNLQAMTIEEVRLKYPLFLLSQPQYRIQDHIKSVSLSYSGSLIRKNVLVLDAGYCEQQKAFKVALGTDEGQVIIFQPNSAKPQQIIDCFGKVSYITCVKWSKNLQYLAIANDLKELKVYSFKQAITIQNHINYRLIKTPVEYCSLNEKQLKTIVIQVEFIDQLPFKMMLMTQNQNLLVLEMKKYFLGHRPHLSDLGYEVKDYLDFKILSTKDKNKIKGAFLAISGWEYVTICLIEPFFQVAMVYDKEKHGGNIKKNGYPMISFRDSPTSLLVVWERYLEIVDINIQSFSPPVYSFSIGHKYLLPEPTILAGFLSNTLVYQATKTGIKVYSTTTFDPESRRHDPKEILFHRLHYSNFCYGERIEEAVNSNQVQLSDLRYLKSLFLSSNRTLFYSTNKGIQMISISTLQSYVSTLIQNSNWKNALQLLKDCHHGVVYELDELKPQSILSKIKQISVRYINFLETIIHNDTSNQKNMLLLWDQQLIFIFNIILMVDLQDFLLDEILPKIYKLNPNYMKNVIPFIMTNKLTQINASTLELLLETVPKEMVSKLIFNLQPNNNLSQLPHQINGILIKHRMFLEVVDLNQKFKDHYTPTAILVGIYLQLDLDNEKNIMELTEEKRSIGKLLAYSVFDTLSSVNFNKYSKRQSQDIIGTLVPLLTDQIASILIKEDPSALFDHIFQQLYMGNCLQILNQLQLTDGQSQLMIKIATSLNKQQVVRYGCQKQYWMFILKLYERKIIHTTIYKGLFYLCIQDHIGKDSIERLLSKCSEQIIQQLSKIPEDILNPFFQSLLQSQHISMVKLVGKLLKRYLDVLEAMLREQSQKNNKIYEYLDECLPLLSALELELLRTILKQNIQLLTDIDPSKASDIICKHFLKDLHMFIDDLDGYQHQQLKLIHAVLQLYSYQESMIELKVKYLELMAITGDQEGILRQLIKENYPLDQSLQICRKYDVLEAYAYLLVKSGATGHIETAIKVYFQLIWQKIYKVFFNTIDPEPEVDEIIMHYLQKCIEICLELDLHDHQIEWFNIMDELQLLKKNVFKDLHIDAHTCQIIKSIVNHKAYPQLIRMMLTDVDDSNVIRFLGMKIGGFDLQAVQTIISEMKKSFLYQKKMEIILQDIFVDNENSFRRHLFIDVLKGFSTSDTCDYCMKKGGLLVHYKCGHEIHPPCSQDVRECIICLQDTEFIFTKKIDAMMKVKTQIYSGGISESLEQVQHQINRQTYLKKMQSYDDRTALTTFSFQL